RRASGSSVTLRDSVRRVFETVLPPHVSEKHCQDALARDLWVAVRDCPIKYRDTLCARFIKMFDIPPPPEPKRRKVLDGPEKPTRDRVVVYDVAGNAWTWNCGWRRVNESGDWVDSKRPLGHATFLRSIRQ